jgi:solute carrier family 25 aspartate/glutamate transporter 12/13
MSSSPKSLPVLHADSGNADGNPASRVVQSVKSAVRAQESEIKRWRRSFDANAKAIIKGEKYALRVFL